MEIGDTPDASQLLNENINGNLGTRYSVEESLGFGLIFKVVRGFEISSLLASWIAIFQKFLYFCYRFWSLFP